VRGRSRGRFATPADFPLHDCSPYSHVHVRREGLGFVHRSRAIFCRPVPNLSALRFATFSSPYVRVFVSLSPRRNRRGQPLARNLITPMAAATSGVPLPLKCHLSTCIELIRCVCNTWAGARAVEPGRRAHVQRAVLRRGGLRARRAVLRRRAESPRRAAPRGGGRRGGTRSPRGRTAPRAPAVRRAGDAGEAAGPAHAQVHAGRRCV
jgi:hypothetical protein